MEEYPREPEGDGEEEILDVSLDESQPDSEEAPEVLEVELEPDAPPAEAARELEESEAPPAPPPAAQWGTPPTPPPPPAAPVAAPPPTEAEKPEEPAWYVAQGGRVYGPYPQQQLREWRAQGQVSAEALVSRGAGDPWRAMWQAPELAPAAGVGEYAAGPRQAPHPTLAGILTFLLPGLGQIYNGQIGKGLVLIGVLLLLGTLSSGVGLVGLLLYFFMMLPLGLIWWTVWIVDAVLIAGRLRRGEDVSPWSCF